MNIYAEKLTKCFNDEVVGKACFPDNLKEAEVIPVFKDKGDSNDKPAIDRLPAYHLWLKFLRNWFLNNSVHILRIFFRQFYLVLERVTILKVLYFVCLKFGINI